MSRLMRIRPSLNEFRYYFNDLSKKIRPELIIQEIEIFNKKEYDLFFIRFSKKDAILGSILQSNGSIHQIAIVRENDGTSRSKLEFLLSVTFMLESLKPNIMMKKKSRILEEIHFFNKSYDIYNAHTTTTYEDVKCTILSSVKGGFFSFCVSY